MNISNYFYLFNAKNEANLTLMYDNIPLDNRLLKQWLKSRFIKDDTLFPTDEGTSQGGIISPILANMVLDGIEDIVKSHKARFQKMENGVILYRHTNRLNFIRYADDFVITGRTPEDLKLVQKDIEKFLNIRGLELSKEKTHITNIRDGFDFLGFNFRKYPNNKVIVTPTKDGIKSFKSKIKCPSRFIRTASRSNIRTAAIEKSLSLKLYHSVRMVS